MTPQEFKKTLAEILDAHDRGIAAFRRASEEMTRATNQVRKARSLMDDAEAELTKIAQRQSAGLDQVLEANHAALKLLGSAEDR